MVNNRVYVPATGGPSPAFYCYGGTGGPRATTLQLNGVVPAGNFKELKIRKVLLLQLTGHDFGKITIEEGATCNVYFRQHRYGGIDRRQR